MGWWPFSKPKDTVRKVHKPMQKDGRTWLLELRDACERNFDNPEEAKRLIRQMQVDWDDCHAKGTLSSVNKEGLESRAYRLLTANDKEWLQWLDDLEFWKVGWRPGGDEEDKD